MNMTLETLKLFEEWAAQQDKRRLETLRELEAAQKKRNEEWDRYFAIFQKGDL
jgi:hypothetical protein